jgi:hydroxymethylbilane synthase
VASPVRLRAATRGSPLARWQTDHVAGLLLAASATTGIEVQVEPVVVETAADRRQDAEIWEMGGKGVFVKEVQAAVLARQADLAVHSAKDLPAIGHPDLVLAAVPERADPRDVLIGATVRSLSPGATIATGSVRRRAQLAWTRPDLTFTGLRGNIATRLTRIPSGGAIVMAAAALDRLGLDLASVDHEVLSPSVMLPQVAQGALAVECRADDARTSELLRAIEHVDSRRRVDAERAFLAELGGDCDLPAAAHATAVAQDAIDLEGLVASLDGHVVLRHRRTFGSNDDGGRLVARYLLDDAGGAALLGR